MSARVATTVRLCTLIWLAAPCVGAAGQPRRNGARHRLTRCTHESPLSSSSSGGPAVRTRQGKVLTVPHHRRRLGPQTGASLDAVHREPLDDGGP